mgnify:CR=1 FL=1
MRANKWFNVVLCALVLSVGSAASEVRAETREADHEALRALKQKVTEAIVAQDADKIVACFAKHFVFTTVDQRVITSKKGVREYYHEMIDGPDAPIAEIAIKAEADDLTRFIDANTGVCVGRSDEAYTLKDGKVFHMKARWTATVVKEDGQWKIAAAHVGVNVLDNPVLDARSMGFWKRIGVWLGIVDPPYEKPS